MNTKGQLAGEGAPHSITMAGHVRPPADMIAAAERSLSPEGFRDLMNQTGGAPPTPAQLCAAVELERSQGDSPTH
jgi:hypothetical protein